MAQKEISKAVLKRLPTYLSYLKSMPDNGQTHISATALASALNMGEVQVRKDLAYFGEFGTRGVGYDVAHLNANLMKILGLQENRSVVIVGAGRLGTALTLYNGFNQRGFQVMGVFDKDMSKVGELIGDHLTVSPMYKLDEFVKKK